MGANRDGVASVDVLCKPILRRARIMHVFALKLAPLGCKLFDVTQLADE